MLTSLLTPVFLISLPRALAPMATMMSVQWACQPIRNMNLECEGRLAGLSHALHNALKSSG